MLLLDTCAFTIYHHDKCLSFILCVFCHVRVELVRREQNIRISRKKYCILEYGLWVIRTSASQLWGSGFLSGLDMYDTVGSLKTNLSTGVMWIVVCLYVPFDWLRTSQRSTSPLILMWYAAYPVITNGWLGVFVWSFSDNSFTFF